MSHLDLVQLEELKDIMEEGFSDLIETYIIDSDEKIAKLSMLINDSDANIISEIAHSLKGSSLNISAQQLGAYFKVIEDQGRENDLNNIKINFEKASSEYQLVKAQLLNLLQ